MKLLFCQNCEDVFKLDMKKMRYCKCGKVYGRYINSAEAEVSESAISLAIGNGSLLESIEDMRRHQQANYDKARREDYYELGQGNILFAWVRPNTGPGNPHSKIISNLK